MHARNFSLEHLGTAENLVAMVEAITKIAEPGTAIAVLSRQSLALLIAIQNDLACECEIEGAAAPTPKVAQEAMAA